MLDDITFVSDSINVNLFFLRTIREFCLTIQLSTEISSKDYSTRAGEIANKCEQVGRELIKYSNGNVSEEALQYQIFVTEYTLPIELLTEKLFNIKLATDITEEELNLTPEVPINPSQEFVNNIMIVNNESLAICNEFRNLCIEIYVNLRKNEVFSYTYPSLLLFMIRETDIYIMQLERLISKSVVDPIYATDIGFLYSTVMQAIAGFLDGLIDPYHQAEMQIFSKFTVRFEEQADLYKNVPLSPSNQRDLIENTISIVSEFKEFMSQIIQKVLDNKINFIIEPLFLDNMYTEINYFIYLLQMNLSQINK